MFCSGRSKDVNHIMSPANYRADHFCSALAASYSYLVFLVFQPRNFILTVRAIPGVNRPILQHRLAPFLIYAVEGREPDSLSFDKEGHAESLRISKPEPRYGILHIPSSHRSHPSRVSH